MTLLCRVTQSQRLFRLLAAFLEDTEQLAGDDPFQASLCVLRVLPFGEPAGDGGVGGGVDAAAVNTIVCGGLVELAVAASAIPQPLAIPVWSLRRSTGTQRQSDETCSYGSSAFARCVVFAVLHIASAKCRESFCWEVYREDTRLRR